MALKRTKKENDDIKDSDADGLSDKEEERLGTDPFLQDSDNDGLGDYQEVKVYGTDPNDPDTDKDSVSDGDEVKMGLNPRGKGKLRDLFIPHEGNNYCPNSLNPKRVLFHATSALAIKASVVLFIVFLPTAAWLTPNVLLDQENEIIKLTNELRQEKNIELLSANDKLHGAAYERAQDMLVKQYFSHISPSGDRFSKWIESAKYDYSVSGENLAMGFADAKGVMNGWMRSPTHYENLVDSDYKDIGVSAVDGLYNGYDTTLVVQFFGTPKKPEKSEKPVLISMNIVDESEELYIPDETHKTDKLENPNELDEFFEKRNETEEVGVVLQEKISFEPILIDESRSKLIVEEKEGGHTIIVSAEVYINGAKKAEARFGNYSIELQEDPFEEGLWTGSSMVFNEEKEQIFSPVVLPSVIAIGFDGAKATKDIPWDNIKPSEPSVVNQYLFIKKQDSGFVHTISQVSTIYFTIMLIFAVIALGLMVLIEIKKQHPKHILSGLGLIALLVLVILM